MRVNLMGPLSAHIQGIAITPSAAKPCQILALLALNGDRLVSKSALFEELWGGTPPSSATTTLHTYIHQLRRQIDKASDRTGRASRDVLVTERAGYSLRLNGGETDVQEFHRLARAGTAAFENNDFWNASELLTMALSISRAPLLSDIQIGPLLTLDALSLEDARMAALNRRIEADLHLGRHLEMVGELRILVNENPINESIAGHYMVALYHSGRMNEALEEFQRLRTALIAELGVEPTPRLRRLQSVILSGGRPLEDPMLSSGAVRPLSAAMATASSA